MKNVSEAIDGGKWGDVLDVDQKIYDRINEKYGTNIQMRQRGSGRE